MVQTNHRVEHLITEAPKNKKDGSVPLPKILKLVQFGFGTFGRLFPELASSVALKLFGTPRIRARHKTSDELLESAHTFEFKSRGLKLKGYEWGTGDKIVLLVHGWESRGTALRTFVPDLIKQNYKVIAFDAPAHGDSPGTKTNIVEYAHALTSLIQLKGQAHGIIAHSFGGAATILAFHKTKPALATKRLVLIASPRNISDPINEAISTLNLPQKVANRFIQKIEKILEAPIEKTTLANAAGAVDIEQVLLIHDKEDKTVPFISSESTFEAFDNSRLISTSGLGHYLLVKDPLVIKRVTQFITT